MTQKEAMENTARIRGLVPKRPNTKGRGCSIYFDKHGNKGKFCNYCNDFIPIGLFKERSYRSDGYDPYCKFHQQIYRSVNDACIQSDERGIVVQNEFTVGFMETLVIHNQNKCFWTGIELKFENSEYTLTIDRVHNEIREYNRDNVVPCCKWFNISIKSELSLEDLKNRIQNHWLKVYRKDPEKTAGLLHALEVIDKVIREGYKCPF